MIYQLLHMTVGCLLQFPTRGKALRYHLGRYTEAIREVDRALVGGGQACVQLRQQISNMLKTSARKPVRKAVGVSGDLLRL